MQSLGTLQAKLVAERLLILLALCALCGFAPAQDSKSAPAKSAVTGRYQGTAKNAAGEVISVTFKLTEKEGAMEILQPELSVAIQNSRESDPTTGISPSPADRITANRLRSSSMPAAQPGPLPSS